MSLDILATEESDCADPVDDGCLDLGGGGVDGGDCDLSLVYLLTPNATLCLGPMSSSVLRLALLLEAELSRLIRAVAEGGDFPFRRLVECLFMV